MAVAIEKLEASKEISGNSSDHEIQPLVPWFETFTSKIARNSFYGRLHQSLGENPLNRWRSILGERASYDLTYIAGGAAIRPTTERNPADVIARNYMRYKTGEKLESRFEIWRNQFGYLDVFYEQAQQEYEIEQISLKGRATTQPVDV